MPETQDVQAEMRRAVDDLIWLCLSDANDDEITDALMLFLHRLSQQKHPQVLDCLHWAVDRCYHWSSHCAQSRATYLAQLQANVDTNAPASSPH